MRVLVLNGGSSSFKCWLGELPGGELPVVPPKPLWETHIDLKRDSSIATVLEPVIRSVPGPVDVVGHRIVHGGPLYRESTLLTAEVRAAISQEAEMAPAHNRFELAAIQAVERILGTGIPQ